MSNDIHALVQIVDLTGIKFRGLNAYLLPEPAEKSETSIEIGVQEQHGDEQIEVRFKADVAGPDARYEIQLAVVYSGTGIATFDQSVITEFIERVAVMAAFPYIREGVASLAARLEVDVPLLGVLRQGEFSITPDEPANSSIAEEQISSK